MIHLKRVYDDTSSRDGKRFLVERLWPRGIRKQKYFAELDHRPEAWQPIHKAARRGAVTLLYSSRDAEHNNALALKQYLERKR